jgi:hypothetical protein
MPTAPAVLRVGFGQSDITPGLGGGPIGSYRRRAITGVHDPLLAVAAVLDDGRTPIALVGIDSGCVMRDTARPAREMIAQRTSIPAANVIISASHTHQGGPVLAVFHAQADPAYADRVAHGIADAVTGAWETRSAAQFAHATGQVKGIHFNRRFLMRDGREVTHPGKMHPEIVRPAGPVDPTVRILSFRDGNRITGAVVRFSCHCTVTEDGTEYSADYVHYIRQHLRMALGDIPVLFLLGACGDVTQVDNQSNDVEKGHAWADRMGETIAREACRALESTQWKESADVAIAHERAAIAIREADLCPPPTLGLGSGDFWANLFEREREHVRQMRANSASIDAEIIAVRIGDDLALASNGGELFAQPAQNIAAASPLADTWVVTLANEYLGYIPTASALYAGGYEVRTARSSYLAADGAQKIVESSLRALRRISSPAAPAAVH